MLIALHGLALRKASDAISPLNAVVEPGCCRTPPPSSRRQRRAPRARARGIGAIKVNAAPFLLVVQCRKAPRRIRGRERNQAQSAATIQGRHRCRRVAASGGEWRVGRPLLRSGRADVAGGGEWRVGRPLLRSGPARNKSKTKWAKRRPAGAAGRDRRSARRRAAPDSRRRQHRPFATNKRSPPTNDRRRPPRGGRPLPLRAPHRRPAQLAHPAGRSRMLIALHGLALRKASDAISPLNAVVEPGCCRTPPPSSRRQRRAPRARARGIGAIKVNAAPFLLVVQCRKAPRRIRGRERNQAQSAATIQGRHRCRRVAASGGEWRVVARCCAVAGADVGWRRVACWSPAAAQWPGAE